MSDTPAAGRQSSQYRCKAGHKQQAQGKWEVKGNIRLSDIEDAIGVTFTAEDCDTFTGFVFQKFGMVPKDGDTKIELEIENMHIIIDKIKEHQVEHAIIEILE